MSLRTPRPCSRRARYRSVFGVIESRGNKRAQAMVFVLVGEGTVARVKRNPDNDLAVLTN
jgi:hypothetical protein